MSISSFTPLDAPVPQSAPGWRASFIGALDGAAFSIPLSLGSVAVVFSHIGGDMLASGVFATLLGLAWIHMTTARNARPALFAARFFEAATMAAMLEQAAAQLPIWGLGDSPGVRLALMCLIGTGAGISLALLYLLRADRFTRFIPAPVFAGFSNSIALALVISQSRSLWNQASASQLVSVVLSIAAVTLVVSFAVRRRRPRWPAAAIGLLAGVALSLLWLAAGHDTPVVSARGWTMTLPLFEADFGALAGPEVRSLALVRALGIDALILGVMMFINTTLAAQAVQRVELVRVDRVRGSLWVATCMTLAGLLGSAPLSGSVQSAVAATRTTPLVPALVGFSGLVAAGVYLSGLPHLIPLAALCGTLLCEAWFMVDRASLRLLVQWLTREPMAVNAREDLALVAAVTATAALINMVAAVFAGLLLGLVLFAVRNARRPVRHVWSGSQLSSNCARSRADQRVLAEHGDTIKVFELDGDLFFGAAQSLERSLRAGAQGAACIVIDWSRVRHLDTSLALWIARYERHLRASDQLPIHAGTDIQGGNVEPELRRHLPDARFEPDLDHALEQAENEVLKRWGRDAGTEGILRPEDIALFRGLDAQGRARLETAMRQKFIPSGEVIVSAGDPSDELILVLNGSASIVAQLPNGKRIRLAGVRRGATLGEIGFLDQAPRSATVVAQDDVTVATLNRETFDALALSEPQLVQRILSNIALDMATRLRHSNRAAVARAAQR